MSPRPVGPEEPEELKGAQGAGEGDDPAERKEAGRQARAPWHFKLLLVGSVGYLGWRAYQGVSWLAHHIH